MSTCINCGGQTENKGWFAICDECENASSNLTNLLKNGLTLDFSDGSSETLYLEPQTETCNDY